MIQGIIFDYGGTIDTDSLHWSEVLWQGYQHASIPVSKEEFRTSYVVAERALAKHPYIRPDHTFLDLLLIKCQIETKDLVSRGAWSASEEERKAKSDSVAHYCYDYVLRILQTSRPIIARLSERYPLVLVSNFYGNIETILQDFRLPYFRHIVESAVVGVRKPDPQIFQLGVEALRQACGKDAATLPPTDIVVIGDSYSKDIVPAHSIGCKTIWIKGIGWGEEQADMTIPDSIISTISNLEDALSHLLS